MAVRVACCMALFLVITISAQNRLMLNTRQSPSVASVVDLNNPTATAPWQSVFSAARPIRIMIHGFGDYYSGPLWQQAVAELLRGEDLNVFRLDWAYSSAALLGYPRAVANTFTVGAQVAAFVRHLITAYGVNAQNIHVIGHSLGAHTAGAVGAALRSNGYMLGRITGLDPAGPSFTGTAASSRLDSTDARVVDTIVTDSNGYGSITTMGHMNFFPNGGYANQPGCSTSLCSHLYALNLFVASINGGTQAVLCPTYAAYVQQSCVNNPRSLIGYRANLALATSDGLRFFSTG